MWVIQLTVSYDFPQVSDQVGILFLCHYKRHLRSTWLVIYESSVTVLFPKQKLCDCSIPYMKAMWRFYSLYESCHFSILYIKVLELFYSLYKSSVTVLFPYTKALWLFFSLYKSSVTVLFLIKKLCDCSIPYTKALWLFHSLYERLSGQCSHYYYNFFVRTYFV